jgi:probable HAF family extracellular repeat protein
MRLNQRKVALALVISLSTAAIGAPPRYTATKLAFPSRLTPGRAVGLNRFNFIVGFSYQGLSPRATVWGRRGVGIVTPLRRKRAYPRAISDSGEIVGTYETSKDFYQAFVVRNGNLITLAGLGAGSAESGAAAINRDGVICGTARNEQAHSWYEHAVYWDATGIHDIAADLNENESYAAAIDNRGRIAGSIKFGDNYVAFIWHKGIFKYLFPNRAASYADAMNNAGNVTGVYWNSSAKQWRAYLRVQRLHDLRTLGGTVSWGNAINSLNDIVGGSHNADDDEHAFLYVYLDDTMYDLNSLLDTPVESPLIEAFAINDHGCIIARDLPGNSYLLTPVK